MIKKSSELCRGGHAKNLHPYRPCMAWVTHHWLRPLIPFLEHQQCLFCSGSLSPTHGPISWFTITWSVSFSVPMWDTCKLLVGGVSCVLSQKVSKPLPSPSQKLQIESQLAGLNPEHWQCWLLHHFVCCCLVISLVNQPLFEILSYLVCSDPFLWTPDGARFAVWPSRPGEKQRKQSSL